MNARQILSGVAFNYLGTFTVVLVGFVSTPIILSHLGKAAFGAWALIAAMIGYSSLLNLGVGRTVMRMVAERAHLSDRRELERIVSTGLAIFTAVGLVFAVLGIALAPVLPQAFHMPNRLHGAFIVAFMLMSVTVGLTFPGGLYTGINQGFGRFRAQNLIEIAQVLTGMGTSIAIVLLGGGLIPLAIGWTASVLAGFALKVGYAVRALHISPNPARFDRDISRSLFSVGGWTFLSDVAEKLIWNTDTLVVGGVLGTRAVARYAVALGPATGVRNAAEQFNTVTFAAAARLRAQDEQGGLRRLLLEATRVQACVIGPFVVLFLLWGHQFLRLWVGPTLSSSASTLVVLVAGMLASSIQATATQILLAFHRQRNLALVAIGEGAVNIACSIVLAHEMGIVGVAIGTAIPTAITALAVYLPYAARLLEVPNSAVLARPLGPLALCAAAYVLIRFVAPPLRFHSLPVFCLFAVVFVGLLSMLGVLLDSAERRTYFDAARSFLRPAAARHTE